MRTTRKYVQYDESNTAETQQRFQTWYLECWGLKVRTKVRPSSLLRVHSFKLINVKLSSKSLTIQSSNEHKFGLKSWRLEFIIFLLTSILSGFNEDVWPYDNFLLQHTICSSTIIRLVNWQSADIAIGLIQMRKWFPKISPDFQFMYSMLIRLCSLLNFKITEYSCTLHCFPSQFQSHFCQCYATTKFFFLR